MNPWSQPSHLDKFGKRGPRNLGFVSISSFNPKDMPQPNFARPHNTPTRWELCTEGFYAIWLTP